MITVDLKSKQLHSKLNGAAELPSLSSVFNEMPAGQFKKGEILFAGGSPSIFFLEKGIVKLYSMHQGKEMLEDYFQTDELINCRAIMGRASDHLAAEAMSSRVVVRKIPARRFEQIAKQQPWLYGKMLANFEASLCRAQERLRRLTLFSAEERVIHFLVSHVLSAGRQVGYEWVLPAMMTHQDMSSIVGTGRQTVTTVLNKLRRQGIVHFNRRYLIIRNLDALQALCPSPASIEQYA